MGESERSLAVILTGLTRLPAEVYVDVIENYKNQFSWATRLDVWFFTWADQAHEQTREVIEPHVHRVVATEPSPTQEMMVDLGIPFTGQLARYPEHAVCRLGHYAAQYGSSAAIDVVESSGDTYTYLVKGRNDLWFEADTSFVPGAIEQQPTSYLTPPGYWCGGVGINDHVGVGLFSTVRKVWSFDLDEFRSQLANCWNIESFLAWKVQQAAVSHCVFDTSRYLIKRYDSGRVTDWVHK
jgi:hypothetical protein